MNFIDRMAITDGMNRTADGYVTFQARVARGGNVQTYHGSELGIMDRDTIRIYRPDAEVFKKGAIKTYAGVPATMGHPKDGVNADNWKDLAIGEVGDEILRDGEFVRVPMTLRDAAAIAAVDAGTRELSMGYTAELTFEDGTSPKGEGYDAVMSGFRMNHVAIVPMARGGDELRIGDAATWGASPVHDADMKGSPMADTLRKIMVDGLQVETTDAGATAIEKLTSQIAAKDAKIKADADAAAVVLATKDAEIDATKAKLKDAEAKVLTADAISKLVADRVALETVAKSIVADVATAGLTDADLKKSVVAAKLGDEAVKDRVQAYIDARFDILAEDAAKLAAADPVAALIKSGIAPTIADAAKTANDAHAKMIADMKSAHLDKAH